MPVVIRLTPRNRVAPRKPLPTQPAPRRLLPLRLRRQTVAAAPIHIRLHLPSPIPHTQARIRTVGRPPPLLFAPRVAPLHTVIPVYRLHRMVGGFPRTGIVERVA